MALIGTERVDPMDRPDFQDPNGTLLFDPLAGPPTPVRPAGSDSGSDTGFDTGALPVPGAPGWLLALGGLSVAALLLQVWLWFDHIGFALHLQVMEGTILQHVERAAALAPVYPAPGSDYVPLAYNPLYYYLSVPFTWVFGVNLFTLRLVAILGVAVTDLLLFAVVRRLTGSAGWGLFAAGLFAAAYAVMDSYLDTAHSDSWLLASVLLGGWLIDRGRSRTAGVLGVLALVAAFWFKQHGALFAVGGVLFLSLRDGVARAWPCWLTAALLGPALYVFAGPALFGSHFHYFTWEVPRGWSSFTLPPLLRYGYFMLSRYPVLVVAGGLLALHALLRTRPFPSGIWPGIRPGIWPVLFAAALLSGLMGALDTGSSNNVFIPAGTFAILFGTLALHRLAAAGWPRLAPAALAFSFAVFAVHSSGNVFIPAEAEARHAELLARLRALSGPVYAPSQGQLPPAQFTFAPAAHWVALEDMIRSPGRHAPDHPTTRRLLAPALDPHGPAFILTNEPLERYSFLCFLTGRYELTADFGDRYQALRPLPSRFDVGWPRYLYRASPDAPLPAICALEKVGRG